MYSSTAMYSDTGPLCTRRSTCRPSTHNVVYILSEQRGV